MPRLPSANDLGGLPGAAGGRPISSIDASGIGAAQREQGQALQGLSGQLQQVADKANERRDTLDAATAEADWTIAKAKLDDARSNETDPEALNGYRDQYGKALQAAAQKISDPQRRQLFLTRNSPDIERGGIAASDQQFKLNQDQSVADANQKLSDLEVTGLKAGDPETRAKAFKSAKLVIDSLESDGYISAVQAQKLRQGWAQGFAEKAVSLMTPAERLAVIPANVGDREKQGFQFYRGQGFTPIAAAGIVGNFSHEGAGMNPAALNPGDGSDSSNSIGFGQWNGERARALMAYANGQGKDWRDFQTQLDFANQEIDQHPGLREKLNSAKSVAEATSIFADEFERPAGAGKGGYDNLKGWQSRLSRASAVATNFGGLPPADKNMAALVGVIPPDRLAAMREGAQREVDQQNRAEVSNVRTLLKDDTASIMETGKPVQNLTPERVAASLGDQAAAQFQEDRRLATRYYNQTNDFSQLPPAEITKRLDALKPEPGSAGYENQQAYYNTAVDKAQKLLKQRQEDPAGAVDSLPDVQEAKQAADPRDPSSVAALGRARMVAQDRIGVPPQLQTPITKAEAVNAMLPLTKAPPGLEKAGMEQVVKQFDATYGPDAEKALTYALTASKVDNDVAEQASKVIRSIAQGRAVSAAQERALNDAIEISAANGTVSFLAPEPDKTLFSDPMTGMVAPLTKPTSKVGVYSNTPPQDIQVALGRVPTQARDALLTNPDLARDFDAKYGAGQPLSKWVLAKHQAMLERQREANRADGFSSLPIQDGTVPRQAGTQHDAPRLPDGR